MLSFHHHGAAHSGTRGFLAVLMFLPPAGWPWGEPTRQPVEIPDRCLEAPLHEAPPPVDAWQELLVPADRPIRVRRYDPDVADDSKLDRWRVWRSPEWTPGALLVRQAPSDANPVHIPWPQIAFIDHSPGTQSPWALGVIGGAIGFLVSLGATRGNCRDDDCSQRNNTIMLTGAGVGVLAGGVLAKLIPRWEPVYCVLPAETEDEAEDAAGE